MAMKVGVLAALLMCMVVVTPHVVAAITCGQVSGSVGPCLGYLRGTGPLSSGCCNGIRGLNAAARTTPDRQTACRCLKSISSSIKGINYGLAGGLPGKCGVNIPYKISPATDCNKVR